MNPLPKKKKIKRRIKKVKAWWLRKGKEGFLTSNLWMNGANARLAAKGRHFADTQKHTGKSEYKVIPCIITYSLPKKK